MTEFSPLAGHNRAPEKTALEWLIEDLTKATKGKEAELNQREAELAKVEIVDDDSAGRATQLGAIFLGIRKELDAERKTTNAPFQTSVGTVNGHYGPLIEAADAALARATKAVDAYRNRIKAEQEAAKKKAEEEADALRKQAEQIAKTDPARAADLFQSAEEKTALAAAPAATTVRSGYGASASGRKDPTFEITDFDLCLAHFKTNELIKEALNKAIAGAVRAKQYDLPGVKVTIGTKTQIRS